MIGIGRFPAHISVPVYSDGFDGFLPVILKRFYSKLFYFTCLQITENWQSLCRLLYLAGLELVINQRLVLNPWQSLAGLQVSLIFAVLYHKIEKVSIH